MAAQITDALYIQRVFLCIGFSSGREAKCCVKCIPKAVFHTGIAAAVCKFCLGNFRVCMVHFRSVLKDIKQRGHIVKLFHDLHILAVIEENTGGVGCKCGEFIRQDTICAGNLYCQIFRLRLQQLVSDFLTDKLSIMVFLEQDVQEDIQRLMVYRGIIGKLEMALFDIIFADAFLFFRTLEREYLGCLFDKGIQIRSGLHNDINVSGQPARTVHQEHQAGTALENKGHSHAGQSLQQSKGVDRTLQQYGVTFAGFLKFPDMLF